MKDYRRERARQSTLAPLLFATAVLALLTSNLVWASAQSVDHYQALIRRGTALLQTGMAAEALQDAKQAIRSNPVGWQAYALAGGALVNLKQYQEAADDFTQALKNAPPSKQSGLSDIRRQSLLAAAGVSAPPTAATPSANGAANDSPSYAETVQWIQSHIGDAQDATDAQLYHGGSYSVIIDGCKTITITETTGSTHSENDQEVIIPGTQVVSVPFTAVKTFEGGGDASGGEIDLTVTEAVRDETDISGSDTPMQSPYIDPQKGMTAEQANEYANSLDGSRFVIIPPGGSKPGLIMFGRPGTGGEAPHLINALNHLAEICKAHPEQARGVF